MANLQDYMTDMVENSWVQTGNATAAQLTATQAAPGPKRHNVVVKCDASYSTSTQDGLLQVLFGATVVGQKYIHGAGAIDFGMLGFEDRNANEAVSAVLAAGAAAVVGNITFTGYTTGPRSGEGL